MSGDDTARTFDEAARTARPGARVCFGNLIAPRESRHARIRLPRRFQDGGRAVCGCQRISVRFELREEHTVEKPIPSYGKEFSRSTLPI